VLVLGESQHDAVQHVGYLHSLKRTMAGLDPAIQGNKHRRFRLWMGGSRPPMVRWRELRHNPNRHGPLQAGHPVSS
jgi:hypothetical protein